MEDIVELRGHHLASVARVHSRTFGEHLMDLIENDYVDRVDDSFVELSWNMVREIFSNPDGKIRIIADKPDFICRACRKIKECFDECGRLIIPPFENISLGPAFAEELEKEKYRTTDLGVARNYDLDIWKVYTAREIRERVGF